MGDSGGDGPHFKWGAGVNAFLIGSMTKPSLKKYFDRHNLSFDIQFGISYAESVDKNLQKEMQINFLSLVPLLEKFLNT